MERPMSVTEYKQIRSSPIEAPQNVQIEQKLMIDVEPVTGESALLKYKDILTEFEKQEVTQYHIVWYCGQLANGNKIQSILGGVRNNLYDDQYYRYRCVINDHIAYRYWVQERLGGGAFGECYKAYDFYHKRYVAIKIIKNEPRYFMQGQEEVAILQRLREEDSDNTNSLVHMIDKLIFRNHLCITFELLDKTLYSHIEENGFQGLELDLTRDITIDILRCLNLLYSIGIVHADLKPENVLLRHKPVKVDDGPKSVAKVIDFGSSCYEDEEDVNTYIQSRYYRAPEIPTGNPYNCAIDMWSLGCLLIEIDSGFPLFPAKNERDLILLYVEMLGYPPPNFFTMSKRAHVFFNAEMKLHTIEDCKGNIHTPGGLRLKDYIISDDESFIDFVSKCLIWNPEDRMTPQEALSHPFLKGGGMSTLEKHSTFENTDVKDQEMVLVEE